VPALAASVLFVMSIFKVVFTRKGSFSAQAHPIFEKLTGENRLNRLDAAAFITRAAYQLG
jgi:hypothetical protein